MGQRAPVIERNGASLRARLGGLWPSRAGNCQMFGSDSENFAEMFVQRAQIGNEILIAPLHPAKRHKQVIGRLSAVVVRERDRPQYDVFGGLGILDRLAKRRLDRVFEERFV